MGGPRPPRHGKPKQGGKPRKDTKAWKKAEQRSLSSSALAMREKEEFGDEEVHDDGHEEGEYEYEPHFNDDGASTSASDDDDDDDDDDHGDDEEDEDEEGQGLHVNSNTVRVYEWLESQPCINDVTLFVSHVSVTDMHSACPYTCACIDAIHGRRLSRALVPCCSPMVLCVCLRAVRLNDAVYEAEYADENCDAACAGCAGYG